MAHHSYKCSRAAIATILQSPPLEITKIKYCLSHFKLSSHPQIYKHFRTDSHCTLCSLGP